MSAVLKLEKRYKKSHNKMILSLKMLVRDEVLFCFVSVLSHLNHRISLKRKVFPRLNNFPNSYISPFSILR